MKIVKILFVVFLLSFATLIDTFGSPGYRNNHRWHKNNNTCPTVGAPLDGGILAVLGVAGVAYLAARKKKKNDQGV